MPTIAILGASTDRHKFGNKAVRAYAQQGYDVYPVHPNATEIEGHRAYRSITDIPVAKLDRVSIYLPPEIGLRVLDEVAGKPATEVWFNPGAESPAILRRAKELGLPLITGCSIVAIGVSPEDFGS